MSSLQHSPASNFSPAHVVAARTELAKRYVGHFACTVDIPTVPLSDDPDESRFDVMRVPILAAHHRLMYDKLQILGTSAVPNLMFLLPPGSAKSTVADVVFVPWFMGRNPRKNVGLASYASDIAKKQGRRARQLIKGSDYQQVFPDAVLRGDQSAADEWALTNGSEFMAGGILSGLTGNRFHVGIWDDLVKGRQAAESEAIRNSTWDAYVDDFCSRLVPGAPQVGITTRWHEDDVAGRILPEDWDGDSGLIQGRDGRMWYVICLPAIADRADDPLGRKIGETLWPEWFNHEHWAPFQKNSRTWASLYQQKPSPDDGSFFKKDWFRRFDVRPKDLRYYMTSDHAPGDSAGSDWNVFRIWGIDPNQHIYMVDGYRSQGTMDEALGIKATESGDVSLAEFGGLPLIRKWKPLCWFPEDDNNWKASKAFVKAAMRRLACHCRIEEISPHGQDKPTKARSIQAKASMGEVWFPNGPLGDAIIDEFVRFPAGKHDDEVDTASIIGRVIDQAHPAIVRAQTNKGPRDRWAKLTDKSEEEQSWKTI